MQAGLPGRKPDTLLQLQNKAAVMPGQALPENRCSTTARTASTVRPDSDTQRAGPTPAIPLIPRHNQRILTNRTQTDWKSYSTDRPHQQPTRTACIAFSHRRMDGDASQPEKRPERLIFPKGERPQKQDAAQQPGQHRPPDLTATHRGQDCPRLSH